MKPGQERGCIIVEPQDKELLLTALGETEDLGPGDPDEIESVKTRINDGILPIEFDPDDSRIILSSLELAMRNQRFSLGYAGRQEANEVYEIYRKEALKQGLW